MNILVLNAGSSSLKYQLIAMPGEEVLVKGYIQRIGTDEGPKNHGEALNQVLCETTEYKIDAVGHRVVHGGEYFAESTLLNNEVIEKVSECIDIAPLHNPPNIQGIKAVCELLPDAPQVAVFDTAFHQTMPKKAYMYALPWDMYKKYKVRKFGMHGTSHKFLAERVAKMLGKPVEETSVITCHLGNGSSIAAVKNGKSIDTSMGFTPLAGVMMGTRSGDIDPAIIPYLVDKTGMTADEIGEMLNKESGLIAISEGMSDFRDLEAANEKGDIKALLALEMFAYHVKKYIGAYLAAMNGADAIVFAGGVGEWQDETRRRILENLDWLGIKFDAEKNKIIGKEVEITDEVSKARIFVIPTNEELAIAKETMKLVTT
ncbi:MAG: acetate kinase [Oscillospiraceae bacterium]|nr:acetate kinase [Oscillospiraceae bacterium]